MNITDEKSRQMRDEMVRGQIAGRGIRDARVIEAMREIPREWFMPDQPIERAYADGAQPIGAGQTISQPYIVAYMTEALNIQPGDAVLEIGAGSGYQTAILARLADHVYAIERVDELARRAQGVLDRLGLTNVTWHIGDGTLGWAEHAPYDRILCAAAGPAVPQPWRDQLADGGRIVMPVGPDVGQQIVRVDRRGEHFETTPLLAVRFVRLIGHAGWPESPT